MGGWIGVDLDGTLAHYDGWKGAEHIGAPISPMLDRVRRWLAEGTEVRIFTARVSGVAEEAEAVTAAIHKWCDEHIGTTYSRAGGGGVTYEQAVLAAVEIDSRFLAPRTTRVEPDHAGRTIAHLRWMVVQITHGDERDRAPEWLGYIQGALVLGYGVSLVEMRDVNRRAKGLHVFANPNPPHRNENT